MITVRNLAKACIGLALAILLISASPIGAEETGEGYALLGSYQTGAGVRNVSVSAAMMAAPAGATGTAEVAVEPHTAGETGEYTIRYIAPERLKEGDTIIVTFPMGTIVDGIERVLGYR